MKNGLDRIADFLEEFKNDIHDMFTIRKLQFLLNTVDILVILGSASVWFIVSMIYLMT